MTLAHQLATGQKTKHDVIDDGFNKHALKDRDGLPDWFIDDEGRHDKPHKPITKAAAAAIREKLRAYNARPIKKVREAKARKKFKAAQRLEKLKKKSDLLANEEGMTEKEKAESIAKMMAKAGKVKRRPKPTLVIAKGEFFFKDSVEIASLTCCCRCQPWCQGSSQGRQGTLHHCGLENEEGSEGAEEDSQEEEIVVAAVVLLIIPRILDGEENDRIHGNQKANMGMERHHHECSTTCVSASVSLVRKTLAMCLYVII